MIWVDSERPEQRDGVAKFNCHTIAIRFLISALQKSGLNVSSATSILDADFVIGVWAAASRPQIETLSPTGATPGVSGSWIQVSRLGMPLTNEAVIPLGAKDRWNATTPANDLQLPNISAILSWHSTWMIHNLAVLFRGLSDLRIQANSLGAFDFRNGQKGLWALKGSPAVAGTALDDAIFGTILLPDTMQPACS